MNKIFNLLCLLFLSQIVFSENIFTVDYDNYIRKHDIVYLDPEYEGYNAFPLGNGDLGGMLWCSENGIQIQLNKIDLYDVPEKGPMTLRSAGKLSIDFGVPCNSYMHLSNFEGRLSLLDAEAQLQSKTAFAETKIKSWLDANSNVWVLECDVSYDNACSAGSEIEVALERWGSRHFGWWYNTYENDVSLGLGNTKSSIHKNDIILTDSFDGGLRFSMVCRVLDSQVHAKTINNHKAVITQKSEKNKKFYVLISVVTSNEADNTTEKAIDLIDKVVNKGIEATYAEHQKWWHSFWQRSFVHLDDDYIENIYYLRRYLMASSSRGNYPAPFNGGLWVTNRDHRQWVTPVHWNNQQSYWGLAEQNDPDLLYPYIQTYYRLMPYAEKYTFDKYGIKDAIAWTEVHDFSGKMLNENRDDMKYNYTPASQIASIFWNYYEFTQNKNCLRDTIYPFLKKTAEFYLNKLEWNPKNNQYNLSPAQPYEHPYTSNLKNPITDRYMIESLFMQCIKSATILHTDKQKINKWLHVINHLWEPPILDLPDRGKVFVMAYEPSGEVYPNAETYFKRQFYHFDAHTTMVFPANILGLNQKDTEYFNIAKNVALHHPQDRNAITPGAIVSARLGLGDKVIERMKNMINYLQHFNQGLFYNIDHWYKMSLYKDSIKNASLITQRDYIFDSRVRYNCEAGHSGLLAKPFVQCGMEPISILGTAVNEMLLQSHEGKIRIFPALPKNKAMAFTLRARGAFIVSSLVDNNGVIHGVQIRSLNGNKCFIQNPWLDKEVTVVNSKGTVIPYKVNKENVISFLTKVDELYDIKLLESEKVAPFLFTGRPNDKPKKYKEAILGKERTFMR